jgi:DNA-binding NarL/FixJ family response regulator
MEVSMRHLGSAVSRPLSVGKATLDVGIVARTVLDREGLFRLLGGVTGLTPLDLGSGGAGSFERVAERIPQIVLTDLEQDAAVPFADALRAQGWRVPILAVLRTGIVSEVFALARAGVTGFLAPSTDARAMVFGLRHLLAKGCTMPPAVAAPVLRVLSAGTTEWCTPGGVVFGLSAREAQAARCVELGLTNREIARALRISPGTAKGLVHKLCRKLDVHSREAAVEGLGDMDRKVERLVAAYGRGRPGS